MHAVVSVIHEMVYCTIHTHVQLRKSNSTSEQKNSCLAVEPDHTLFRYCSAALHQMIRLRKETLQQKKGCGKVSTERCLIMEKELELLNTLVMKDEVMDGVLKLWFPRWRIHESTNSWMLKFKETSKFPGKLLMQTRWYGQNLNHILWLPNESRWTCNWPCN